VAKITNAIFNTSSTSTNDAPSPDISEIAFLGRSNVGKSSLLNRLTKRKNLAKSSSTPGKTRLINIFDVTFKNDFNDNRYYTRFVDLPGFGYAKVSKTLKEEWGKNLTSFLQYRFNIRVFIHLIDARHPELDIDINVSEYLYGLKRADQAVVKVFTKIDKLKQSDLQKLRNKNQGSFFVSNLKNSGLDKLTNELYVRLFGEENVAIDEETNNKEMNKEEKKEEKEEIK
jgi:GTP-binding protein